MKLVKTLGIAVMSVGLSASAFAGQKVQIEQVPAPARATIQREAAGAPLTEIEREHKAGNTVYQAEFTANGQKREIEVTPEGELLSEERD